MPLADTDAYHFELSFRLPEHQRIDADEVSVAIAGVAAEDRLEVRSEGSNPMKDAKRLSLVGYGYANEAEATTACKRAQTALVLAALESFCGVEIEKTTTGAPDVWKGIRAVCRIRGSMQGTAITGTNALMFGDRLTCWLAQGRALTEAESECVELLSDFHFDLSYRSRYLLAYAAIERLCAQPIPRDEAYVEALDTLMGHLDQATSDAATRKELKSAMHNLRFRTGQALCVAVIKSKLGEGRASEYKKVAKQRHKIMHEGRKGSELLTELYCLACDLLFISIRPEAKLLGGPR